MSVETQEYRSILHTSRPLRYAFIVDLEASEISKQLTDIFQFSFRMWGGCQQPRKTTHLAVA